MTFLKQQLKRKQKCLVKENKAKIKLLLAGENIHFVYSIKLQDFFSFQH